MNSSMNAHNGGNSINSTNSIVGATNINGLLNVSGTHLSNGHVSNAGFGYSV